jgi:hypothetical protein
MPLSQFSITNAKPKPRPICSPMATDCTYLSIRPAASSGGSDIGSTVRQTRSPAMIKCSHVDAPLRTLHARGQRAPMGVPGVLSLRRQEDLRQLHPSARARARTWKLRNCRFLLSEVPAADRQASAVQPINRTART